MIERYIENFKLYFPVTAAKAVKYEEGIYEELVVILSDGTNVIYDDVEKTIMTIPQDRNLTESEFIREFSRRLRKFMWRNGFTQTELSEITGISQSQISLYVSGKMMPSFYKADVLAKALDCSVDELRYF